MPANRIRFSVNGYLKSFCRKQLNEIGKKIDGDPNYDSGDREWAIAASAQYRSVAIERRTIVKIVSIVQQKGGVGKTTLTVHLAHELRRRHNDLRVAIADADPQQSALKWVHRGEKYEPTGLEAFEVAHDGEGKRLKKELDAIAADIVLIDLPPAIASVSLRAALYSNLILIPVGASALDIEAGRAAVDLAEEALELDSSKRFLIVPSKVRASTAAGRELRSVLQAWGPLAKTTVTLRVAFSDAATVGQGIGAYAPSSAAHKEIQSLTNEVETILWSNNHGTQAAIAG